MQAKCKHCGNEITMQIMKNTGFCCAFCQEDYDAEAIKTES